jgi:hypothetical protein
VEGTGHERPKHYKCQHLQEYSRREFGLEQMGQDGCHLCGGVDFSI